MGKVYSALTNSLTVTQKYKKSWGEMEDCRKLRTIFQKFEIEACFRYNYNLYILMVLCCIAAFVLLLLTWVLCCALRNTGDDEP